MFLLKTKAQSKNILIIATSFYKKQVHVSFSSKNHLKIKEDFNVYNSVRIRWIPGILAFCIRLLLLKGQGCIWKRLMLRADSLS